MKRITWMTIMFCGALTILCANFAQAQEDNSFPELPPLPQGLLEGVEKEMAGLSRAEQLDRIDKNQNMLEAEFKMKGLRSKFLDERALRLIGLREFLIVFQSSDIKDLKRAQKLMKDNQSLLKRMAKIDRKQQEAQIVAQKKADKMRQKEELAAARAQEKRRRDSLRPEKSEEVVSRGIMDNRRGGEKLMERWRARSSVESSGSAQTRSTDIARGKLGPNGEAMDFMGAD